MQTSPVSVPRKSTRRLFFIGVLLAIVVVQVIAMAELMQSQVRSAEERNALEASSRLVITRCLDSSAQRRAQACPSGNAPHEVTEVIDNTRSVATSAYHKERAGVVRTDFTTQR